MDCISGINVEARRDSQQPTAAACFTDTPPEDENLKRTPSNVNTDDSKLEIFDPTRRSFAKKDPHQGTRVAPDQSAATKGVIKAIQSAFDAEDRYERNALALRTTVFEGPSIKFDKPEPFKGDMDQPSSVVRTWMQKYEAYLQRTSVPCCHWRSHIKEYLIGEADDWYKREVTDAGRIQPWLDFRENMIKRFSSFSRDIDCIASFRKFRMQDDYEHYCQRFSELLSPVENWFNEDLILCFFMDGLHQSIRPIVVSRNHATLDSAKEHAQICWSSKK